MQTSTMTYVACIVVSVWGIFLSGCGKDDSSRQSGKDDSSKQSGKDDSSKQSGQREEVGLKDIIAVMKKEGWSLVVSDMSQDNLHKCEAVEGVKVKDYPLEVYVLRLSSDSQAPFMQMQEFLKTTSLSQIPIDREATPQRIFMYSDRSDVRYNRLELRQETLLRALRKSYNSLTQ